MHTCYRVRTVNAPRRITTTNKIPKYTCWLFLWRKSLKLCGYLQGTHIYIYLCACSRINKTPTHTHTHHRYSSSQHKHATQTERATISVCEGDRPVCEAVLERALRFGTSWNTRLSWGWPEPSVKNNIPHTMLQHLCVFSLLQLDYMVPVMLCKYMACGDTSIQCTL